MPRHGGESNWHAGSLTARTRKARKARGRKKQSWKDKTLYMQRSQVDGN